MIIERNMSCLCVFKDEPVKNALEKINSNKLRTVFVVSSDWVLEGVVTDGDFRRWILGVRVVDLSIPVCGIMNEKCSYLDINSNPTHIESTLTSKILAIPLVDAMKKIVGVAIAQNKILEICGRIISADSPVFIVAEIGNNHNGDIDKAKKLVDVACRAGADCVKFQMRDITQICGDIISNVDKFDLGAQYTYQLIQKMQLCDNDMFKIFDYCNERKIIPLCTPWDNSSLEKLEKYGMGGYKISSADFTNFDLIRLVANTNKTMICSTGMSEEVEIRDGIEYLKNLGAKFALLHCNSTYPAPFKDINLMYMKKLYDLSGAIVGYSGHERGFSVAIAAVAMGAKIIEKHITLDKNMEGQDHKVSLLPEELCDMVRSIRQVEESLGSEDARIMSQGEMINREVLAKSIVANCDIPVDTVVRESMLTIRSPGLGIQPSRKRDLVGRKLLKSKKVGDYFFLEDLGEGVAKAANYDFGQYRWGIPVRYHDYELLTGMSNINLVELHLSYQDLELDFSKYINSHYDYDLVVHAPELFANDHVLDLCADDINYREQSVKHLQRVIRLTNELKPYFRSSIPRIVVNVGGFSAKGHLGDDDKIRKYIYLEDSLRRLNAFGVELLPQTMPPFPWHFGGQQFHNVMLDCESIIDFCSCNNVRVCLDVSHSKLACNFRKTSFDQYMKDILPYVSHMHIADAKGVDGEGLQILDGELDWEYFWSLLIRYSDCSVSFIPEVWQGHKNEGEGAWKALSRLEACFHKVVQGKSYAAS